MNTNPFSNLPVDRFRPSELHNSPNPTFRVMPNPKIPNWYAQGEGDQNSNQLSESASGAMNFIPTYSPMLVPKTNQKNCPSL